MTHSTTARGNPLKLLGNVLQVGDKLPLVKLVANDMSDLNMEKLFPRDGAKGNIAVIVTVPSLDTPVCSVEAKRFNTEATALSSDVQILVVSYDLPFAQKRWCAAEGATRVVTASDFKYREFGEAYGVYIQEWGILSRSVFVADRDGTLKYVSYVPELGDEPNYAEVLQVVNSLK